MFDGRLPLLTVGNVFLSRPELTHKQPLRARARKLFSNTPKATARRRLSTYSEARKVLQQARAVARLML